MIINMYKKSDELNCKPPDLITRPVGRVMYKSVRTMIDSAMDGETILFDFNGIRVIDSSFIDETIVKLIVDSVQMPKIFFIKLKNISEITEINIDMVFKSYWGYKNKKIVVITENICHNNAFFIGPLSDTEKDIVEFLRVNKFATLNDIMKFSGVTMEHGARIMDELYSMRVIKKGKDGIYRAV